MILQISNNLMVVVSRIPSFSLNCLSKGENIHRGRKCASIEGDPLLLTSKGEKLVQMLNCVGK